MFIKLRTAKLINIFSKEKYFYKFFATKTLLPGK